MNVTRSICVPVLIASAIAICASGEGANASHYLVLNDSDVSGENYGTVLRLAGTLQNPDLNVAAKLNPGEPGGGTGNNEDDPQVQAVRHGGDVCVFLKDEINSSGTNEISSFKYPGLTLVANYTDSSIPNGYYPDVIVASGEYLFVGFSHYIASWAIGSGCTLSLLQTTYVQQGSLYLAATPDGKTLVGSNGSGEPDSYSIGPNGTLAENGPFDSNVQHIYGVDITADSTIAIFAVFPQCGNNCTTAVSAFLIKPDGSLDSEEDFGGDGSLGNSEGVGFVRLSPDEKYLYTSGGNGSVDQIITLNFRESPLDITYAGCTTALRQISGIDAWSLRTIAATGAGGGLYVTESNLEQGMGAVGLLTIDPSTGCTTEAPSSPFSLSDSNAAAVSLVAWPPRPF